MNIKALLTENRLLFNLTLPLMVSGFMESSIGFSSTMFLAHLGQRELAAGALASWLFITLMVIMWGILTSVSALVARFHGAQDQMAIKRTLYDGLILALLLVIPSMLMLWFGAPILLLLGQNSATVALAQLYLHSLMWGMLPDFIMLVLLQFVIGLGHTRLNLFFTLAWVPFNIAFNYILMFGKLGLPALGIAGIGWGTTLAFWLIALCLSAYLLINKSYRIYFDFATARRAPSQLRALLQLGLPVGAMYCLEIAFFMTLSLLMGRISYLALAANQITLQYLWLLSVITGCLAQAVTVRLGHNIGAKQLDGCGHVVIAGCGMALLFSLFVAIIYVFFPAWIIGIDLDLHAAKNRLTIELAEQFLLFCAMFQILEAIRLVGFGALRALKDTAFSLYTSVFMFWGVALGIGYYLAFHLHWQGKGLWTGMVLGAACGAVILQWRLYFKLKQL